MLALLGYGSSNAGFLLAYEDFKTTVKLVSAALTRLRTLYVGHKLSKSDTQTAIDSLGVDPKARDQLLQFWDVEASANVAVLTAAEVAVLFKYSLMSADDAINRLQGLGFSADDAWYRLAAEVHAAPTSTPPAGYSGTAPTS